MKNGQIWLHVPAYAGLFLAFRRHYCARKERKSSKITKERKTCDFWSSSVTLPEGIQCDISGSKPLSFSNLHRGPWGQWRTTRALHGVFWRWASRCLSQIWPDLGQCSIGFRWGVAGGFLFSKRPTCIFLASLVKAKT